MKLLAIETATEICSVALAEDDRVLAESCLNIGKVHAERLAVMVKRLLDDVRVSADEVDVVAVSEGPGSFTGLRIGMCFAKGFVLPGGSKLVLVPTLAGLAFRLGPSEEPIVALLRSRRSEFYLGIYRWTDGQLHTTEEPAVVAEREVPERVPEGAVVTGHVDVLAADVVNRILAISEVRLVAPWLRGASASAIALLGLELARQGRFADPATAEPFYLQEFVAKKPRSLVGDGR